MSATARLPLVPLGTVLFPGVLLPLHVFEQRHRRLVRDLLAGAHEERRFGSSRSARAGRSARMVSARCTRSAASPGSAGSNRTTTAGSTSSPARCRGSGAGAGAGTARALVADAWSTYRDTLGGTDDDADVAAGADGTSLSYLVAADMELGLADRQRLLEAPDTTERLLPSSPSCAARPACSARCRRCPAVELTHVPASPN